MSLRILPIVLVAIFSFAFGATMSSIFFTKTPPKSSSDRSDLTSHRQTSPTSETLLLSRLQEENSKLKRELHQAATQAQDEAKSLRATILEDHLRLFESYPGDINIRTFSPELKVTPEIADILGMTTADISKVEKALSQAREKLESIESRYFTITEQTPQKTSFEIRPFTEGQSVKDDLVGSITNTLGERRAKIFLENSRQNLSAQFSDFGNDRLTKVEIFWGSDPSKDQIKQTFTNAGGTYSSTGPLDSLPARYLKLIKIENTAQQGAAANP
jgi:hypothetical protein